MLLHCPIRNTKKVWKTGTTFCLFENYVGKCNRHFVTWEKTTFAPSTGTYDLNIANRGMQLNIKIISSRFHLSTIEIM